jgi:hypothetical protein
MRCTVNIYAYINHLALNKVNHLAIINKPSLDLDEQAHATGSSDLFSTHSKANEHFEVVGSS